MISDNQILDAINAITARVFPGRLTYREAAPEKFERPSLLLGHEPRTLVSRSGYLAEFEERFFIVLAAEVDDHYEANTDALNDDLFRLSMAFDTSLPVADRHLHIDKMTAERDGATGTGGSVDLYLHWFEFAPAIPQAEAETAAHASIHVTTKND